MEQLLKHVPKKPGVYRFKDANGNVLYVGKAKDLAKRVRSYFQKDSAHSTRTRKMIEQIADTECTVTASELEALLLETNLIKELQPKYNILMRDDKNYVYIKVTTGEDYPRVSVTRKVVDDGARYFGPKLASSRVWKTLDLLKKLFPFRTCSLDIAFHGPDCDAVSPLGLFDSERPSLPVTVTKKTIRIPCLYYAIKRCPAPCIGKVTPGEYRALADRVVEFLHGKTDALLAALRAEMQVHAAARHFEAAAHVRDTIAAVEELSEKQHVSEPMFGKQDVVSFVVDHGRVYFTLFMIRDGKLINQENFLFQATDATRDSDRADVAEVMRSFLAQYYDKALDRPDEVVIPEPLDDQAVFEQWLNMKIVVPHRGRRHALIDLATTNAKQFAVQWRVKWMSDASKTEKALDELAQIFGLPARPHRIECYDISHLGGTQTVASMVVFEDGQPQERAYRKFKLHVTPQGKPDDVHSMAEVLERRIRRLAKRPGFSAPAGVTIRSANKRDRDVLVQCMRDFSLGKEPLSLRSILVAECDGALAAFGRIFFYPGNVQEVAIRTLPAMRGRGIGTALFQALLRKVRGKKVYVVTGTSDRAFYEGFQFHLVKEVPPLVRKKIRGPYTKWTCANEGLLTFVYRPKTDTIDQSFAARPDLIVVDGGKPQLSAARRVLERLGVSVPVVALAKREEELFLPDRSEPLRLARSSAALHLMQYLRDEAHRFALHYQTVRRGKEALASELDILSGVGPGLKMKLLRHFGSLIGIRRAPIEAVSKVVGRAVAEEVKAQLG